MPHFLHRPAATAATMQQPTSTRKTTAATRSRARFKVSVLLFLTVIFEVCLGSVDEFMTCDRLLETKRAARTLEQIPCDMTSKSYCEHKGASYPEAAIWRFKEENRALMKRLYGDMESNSVYREMRAANLQGGGHHNGHGGGHGGGGGGGTLHNLPSEEHSIFSSLEYNIRMGSGLATVQSARKPVVADAEHRLPVKKKKKVIKKKRKPVASAAAASQAASQAAEGGGKVSGGSNTKTSTSSSGGDKYELGTETPEPMMMTTSTTTTPTMTAPTSSAPTTTTTTETNKNPSPTSMTPVTSSTSFAAQNAANATATAESVAAAETTTITSTTTIATTASSISSQEPAAAANYDFLPASSPEGDDDDSNNLYDAGVEGAAAAAGVAAPVAATLQAPPPPIDFDTLTPLFPELVPALAVTSAADSATTAPQSSSSSTGQQEQQDPLQDEYDLALSELLADVDLESLEQIVGELMPKEQQEGQEVAEERVGPQQQQQQQAVKEQVEPAATEGATVGAAANDGSAQNSQQQAADKTTVAEEEEDDEDEILDDSYLQYDEYEEEPQGDYLYTGPSMNACPVKEEVFAPYWANNTRDQVLALLNLYPFEQYIHMETCKFEDEQMMCRPGCKCEQQYRLHRLLAFDPNNECRGIFSDWFRFPSYCVCKCYNFPENYLPRRNRKPEASAARPNGARSRETKMNMVQQQVSESEDKGGEGSYETIPAILPYEARLALLRDLRRRGQRKLELAEKDSTEEVSGPPPAKEEPVKEQHQKDKTNKKSDSAEHFLYGNMPVVEYQLSDGSGGTVVGKTPRR